MMIIYEAERDIAEKLLSRSSVISKVVVDFNTKNDINLDDNAYVERLLSKIGDKEAARQYMELMKGATPFSFDAILASVGWNLNDDVFLPEELVVSYKTSESQRCNLMHTDATVGVINKSWLVRTSDPDATIEVDLSSPLDSLNIDNPMDLSIRSNIFIFRSWMNENNAKIISQVINAIENREVAVSLEAMPGDIAYAFRKPGEDEFTVIERTEETAFLSRYLRIVGGPGVYKGYEIGRVVKSLLFLGVGIVDNPANVHSTIVANVQKFSEPKPELILILSREQKKENKMNLEDIKTALKDILHDEASKSLTVDNIANAVREAFSEELNQVKEAVQKIQQLEAEKTELENTVAGLQEQVASLEEANKQAIAERDEYKNKVEALEKENEELKTQIVVAKRMAELKQRDIEEVPEEFIKLDDASFAAVLALIDDRAKTHPSNKNGAEDDKADAKKDDSKQTDDHGSNSDDHDDSLANTDTDQDFPLGVDDASDDDVNVLASWFEENVINRKN